MRLTWRDGTATLVVAALMGAYVGLLNGGIGFIQGPRSMAAIGLISALVLCPLSGIKVFDVWAGAISILGAITLGLGIATVLTESWAMLAAFITAILAMWAMATLHHALGRVHGPTPRAGPAHA